MVNEVRSSEAAKASHIPLLPQIIGRSTNAGTRNISPLHSAKTSVSITAGLARSEEPKHNKPLGGVFASKAQKRPARGCKIQRLKAFSR